MSGSGYMTPDDAFEAAGVLHEAGYNVLVRLTHPTDGVRYVPIPERWEGSE